MKLLLAGPGTGKTARIKELIEGQEDASKVLVVSFTNATIQDLLKKFNDAGIGVNEKNCMTLHKYALKLNPQRKLHILNAEEVDILVSYAKKFSISFDDLCKTLRCITFEQMITQTTAYIENNPAYLGELIGDIKLFVVDEFQDFNPIERELINSIANHADQTIILGDDDQCIYEFKDADTDGIIKLYKDSTVENLTHPNICYRCPDAVVDAAAHLITRNKRRVPKEWKKNSKAGNLEFKQLRTQDDTANYVLAEMEKIRSSKPEASIMILSPVEFSVETILTLLDNKNIPYKNLWSKRVDADKTKKIWEVRTILGDKNLLNLLFLIHEKVKGSKSILKNIAEAINKKLDFEALLELSEKNGLIDSAFSSLVKKHPSLPEIVSMNEYSFLSDNLHEESLEDDLESLSKLMSEPIEFDHKGINILSIHKSKGLQANYVFIVGMVEGIMPNVLRGLDTIEAQRRLLFVGMTRAEDKLYLLSTIEWDGKYVNRVDKSQFKFSITARKWLGSSSSFLGELK